VGSRENGRTSSASVTSGWMDGVARARRKAVRESRAEQRETNKPRTSYHQAVSLLRDVPLDLGNVSIETQNVFHPWKLLLGLSVEGGRSGRQLLFQIG